MSTTVQSNETLPLVIPYQPMRMTVAHYHRMIASGELTENRRIELLKGVMVEKMTHNPPHSDILLALQSILLPMTPAGFIYRCQVPITLADSEPEPDVFIARGSRADFRIRHAGPTEVPLVIEIADSSLVTDRFKGEIYAEAGIPIYWIVNLPDQRVEVRSQPSPTPAGPRYAGYQEYRAGDMIPVQLDGRVIGQISAAELLPEIQS